MTHLQAVNLAKSYYFRQRLAEDLTAIAEKLKEFVLEHEAKVIGPFKDRYISGPQWCHTPIAWESLAAVVEAVGEIIMVFSERKGHQWNCLRAKILRMAALDFKKPFGFVRMKVWLPRKNVFKLLSEGGG